MSTRQAAIEMLSMELRTPAMVAERIFDRLADALYDEFRKRAQDERDERARMGRGNLEL